MEMKTKNKLIIAIERSQAAYQNYGLDKKYIQALRIYNANQEVYKLLQKLLYQSKTNKEEIFNYLFHLEDWFATFESAVESGQPQLGDFFAFERISGSIAYPKEFYSNLKKK